MKITDKGFFRSLQKHRRADMDPEDFERAYGPIAEKRYQEYSEAFFRKYPYDLAVQAFKWAEGFLDEFSDLEEVVQRYCMENPDQVTAADMRPFLSKGPLETDALERPIGPLALDPESQTFYERPQNTKGVTNLPDDVVKVVPSKLLKKMIEEIGGKEEE